MESSAIDYVIRGEGEVAMPALPRALRSAADVVSVRGIVRRRADGTIQVSEPAVLQVLDDHPGPALQLLEHPFYRRKKQGQPLSRPAAAARCDELLFRWKVLRPPLPARNSESVLREMEEGVLGYAVGLVDFEDENISLERNWFLELLNGMKKSNFRPGTGAQGDERTASQHPG